MYSASCPISTILPFRFCGANSISGNNSFYTVTKTVTSADTLTFQAGSTQNFAGVLTLKGDLQRGHIRRDGSGRR